MAITLLIIPLKDQDEQVSEGCLRVSNCSHGATFMHNCSLSGNLVGARWVDVSTGALFKRFLFTYTSLGVTLALLISDGLKGCCKPSLCLNDSE